VWKEEVGKEGSHGGGRRRRKGLRGRTAGKRENTKEKEMSKLSWEEREKEGKIISFVG